MYLKYGTYNFPIQIWNRLRVAFAGACVSIIFLVDETISFSLLLIIGENFWKSFYVTSVHKFKESVKMQTNIYVIYRY